MTEIVRCPLRTIALVSLLLGIGLASPSARADQRVGIDSAVNPNAMGIPPGGVPRRLVLGQDVVFNERITTEAEGQTQILFVDESTLSVGPNANMVIDQFVYDPNAGTGKLAASLTRGVFRFVGGKLSKQDNAVTMRTPTATIGIRGGVMLVNLRSDCTASGSRLGATGCNALEVIFVYGKGVTVTGLNGVPQTITRPGFAVTVSGPGASPSDPAPAPPGATAALLAQIDGRAGGNGGATTVPTEVTVANSGIDNTISANITPNTQTVGQAAATQPQSVAGTVQQTVPPTTIQAGSLQGGPATATLVNPISPITPTPQVIPPTTPVVITQTSPIRPPTTGGFNVQTPAYRIPYANGMITYPPGSVLQSGTFAAAFGNTGPVTLAPLTPGSTNAVTATAASGATAAGTATVTPDGKFFYANLTANNGVRLFVFGGVPINQSFYAPTATNQFYAFTVYPDAALGSATGPQTIPFLPGNYGGTMPNATVSPIYLATIANSPFGSYNGTTNPEGVGEHYLQASPAVNGQGVNQSSALVVTTGGFETNNTGTVYGSGPVRGTVFQSATGPLVFIASGASTVPDGNGNNLFGANTLQGFVLDQNSYSSGNPVSQLASAETYLSGVGVSTTNYGFNQPVTSTSLPANTGVTRSTLNESGYFGGIMQCCSTNSRTNAIISYVLTGGTSVQTFPSDNRIAAIFSGTDPFTSAQSGLRALTLQFGAPSSAALTYNRTAFIDNNVYAAAENPNTPSSIIQTINGVPTTETLPTYPSGSTLYPRLAMVTSQYRIPADIAEINTWVAGQPTVNTPTTAVGPYKGAAVGTVPNNGATYLAAGGFNQMYNFGSQAGMVYIKNFDGASYSAEVSGSRSNPVFASSPTGPTNRNGFVSGSFYGPSAQETGGTLGIQSVKGPKYLASGIFAGK